MAYCVASRIIHTMAQITLTQVNAQMQCGEPLKWDVFDENGKLLLARGYVIHSQEVLERLRKRGVYVDFEYEKKRIEEKMMLISASAATPPASFDEDWERLGTLISDVLRNYLSPVFLQNIAEAESIIINSTHQHPDQLIYSIVQHKQDDLNAYGILHSIHVAAVCNILATRLKWPSSKRKSIINAALTMNLSIIDLQGNLAANDNGLTAEQRQIIHHHPTESVRMLREIGVTDEEWLEAVAHHHEQPNGKGYPAGLTGTLSDTSQMLRFADIFMAKFSARKNRKPVPARQAAKDVFLSSNNHPIASALLKEFGIYPPGCYVLLESGEHGIVIKRTERADAPLVAILSDKHGQPVSETIWRETALPRFAIVRTLPSHEMDHTFSKSRLYAAATS